MDPMNTTPLWVPLAVAVLGMVGTLTGVMLTLRSSAKREDVRWEQERAKDREVWAREDAARTFDERRAAYWSFYEALHSTVIQVEQFAHGSTVAEELPEDWQYAAWSALLKVRIFGVPRVVRAANEAYDALYAISKNVRYGRPDATYFDAMGEYDVSEKLFIAAIRDDLGVPSDPPVE